MKQKKTLIHQVRLPGSDLHATDGWLLIESGRIEALGNGKVPDEISSQAEAVVNGNGSLVLPGFIDIHTHGAVGVDLMEADVDGLRRVSQFFARHGVTGFLATSWSASVQSIDQMITNVKAVMGRESGASILGIHLEGPFINPVRAGAQSPREIRPARREEVLPYLDSGLIKVVTLAPEVVENQWLISACNDRGICVSAGHSDASYEETQLAIELGLQSVTHTYNGMRAFNHREPGVVGAALEIDDLTCEVIADGVHVHPAAIRLLMRMKPPQKVILVTDSISGTGNEPGIVEIQGMKVRVTDCDARLLDGTLAGSVLTMDKALSNLMGFLGKPAENLYPYTSQNAARLLGLEDRKGEVKAGMDADLVLLDSLMTVQMTIVNGEVVYQL